MQPAASKSPIPSTDHSPFIQEPPGNTIRSKGPSSRFAQQTHPGAEARGWKDQGLHPSQDVSRDYIRVEFAEPHVERRKRLLETHPEVKKLFGINRYSAIAVIGIVALQIAIAFALQSSPLWVLIVAGFCVGAYANHALWTLIHECTHNLVFRSTWANKTLAIVANLPFVFPGAIGFRTFHLLHHQHQGDLDRDADLPGPQEAYWMGKNIFTRALWLFTFFFFEGVFRPNRLKGVRFINPWLIANVVVEVAFISLIVAMMGWAAFGFLFFSSIFSIGLHPVGARWVQEHFVVAPNQETFSYYGPLNILAFNVGYHNEHHDLMNVPWHRLPKLRRTAPEFYDHLYAHQSWTALLLRFLFDPKLTLYSRVVRD